MAAFLTLLQVGCSPPGPVIGVSVRDANFEVVKVLTPEEVPAFARLWDDKQEVQVSLGGVGGQHFKLDVDRQHSNRRWLYQTTGYASLLDISAKPVYKLRDAEAFNKLIGAPQVRPNYSFNTTVMYRGENPAPLAAR